ncbi:MAG: protein translocase subunit SecF [Halofilum sp. (in: g-proteobacteria)]|nr:protein translocase subunit SecF [Halofilum sp. (in: g-proteobacteria)]
MEFFRFKREFGILQQRRLAFIVSSVLIVISLGSIAFQGLRLGIDFTGGYLIEVGYEKPAELEPIRATLRDAGFADAQVQHFGSQREVLVRVGPQGETSSAELSDRVIAQLGTVGETKPDLRRVEFVGPQVGEELRDKGGVALLLALMMILLYVAFRFEKRFALGSVAALVHDVLIVVGVFSVLRIEFDLPVLAALLAVIGYSLNDTIVVFDRIRENFRRQRHGTAEEITNGAINQTLARTLMTSITTLLVLLTLLIVGGEAIHNFALALTVGVIVGTYSSIFVASALLLALGLTRQDMMPVQKEGAEADGRP